jgi:stage III sporulation protein AE
MMNKKITAVFIFLLLSLLFPMTVLGYGQDASTNYESSEQSTETDIQNELEISGANGLFDSLPDGVNEQLSDLGISDLTSQSLTDFSFGSFMKSIWNTIKKEVTAPIKTFVTLVGIMMLCALLNTFRSSMEDTSVTKIFSVVTVLCVCAAIIVPVAKCITESAQVIKDCSNFILSFIPVFASIVTVSGKPLSATLYSTFLFSAVQIISKLSATTLVPLLSIYLAFCLVSSISEYIKLDGLVSIIKSTVMWALGPSLTIFVALLSMQGLVTNSADTVATKTAKFVIGSTIPVVGGALSEAYNSIQGCMGLIKSTVGVFGIIACILIFLPIIIKIVLLMFSLNIAAAVGEILGIEKVPSLLKAASTALSLILGIVICFAVLLIVSTTIMLVLGLGM